MGVYDIGVVYIDGQMIKVNIEAESLTEALRIVYPSVCFYDREFSKNVNVKQQIENAIR